MPRAASAITVVGCPRLEITFDADNLALVAQRFGADDLVVGGDYPLRWRLVSR